MITADDGYDIGERNSGKHKRIIRKCSFIGREKLKSQAKVYSVAHAREHGI